MPESSGKKLPSPLKLHYFLAASKGEGEGERLGSQTRCQEAKILRRFCWVSTIPQKNDQMIVHEDTTKLIKQPFKLGRNISNSRERARNSGHLSSNLSFETRLRPVHFHQAFEEKLAWKQGVFPIFAGWEGWERNKMNSCPTSELKGQRGRKHNCVHKAALHQLQTKGISQSKCSHRAGDIFCKNKRLPSPGTLVLVRHAWLQYLLVWISKETSCNVFQGYKTVCSLEDKHMGSAIVVNSIKIIIKKAP